MSKKGKPKPAWAKPGWKISTRKALRLLEKMLRQLDEANSQPKPLVFRQT
jgi:hypothetical protein